MCSVLTPRIQCGRTVRWFPRPGWSRPRLLYPVHMCKEAKRQHKKSGPKWVSGFEDTQGFHQGNNTKSLRTKHQGCVCEEGCLWPLQWKSVLVLSLYITQAPEIHTVQCIKCEQFQGETLSASQFLWFQDCFASLIWLTSGACTHTQMVDARHLNLELSS